MKIKYILFFLLLISSTQTDAQNNISKDPYIPVLADTLDWREVWGSVGDREPGNIGGCEEFL
jgi:hypothetical protein